MIFVAAANEHTVVLMLSEQDVITLREGRTLFVDERATKGATFKNVILSLHKTNEEALATLRAAGHSTPSSLITHEPLPSESRCSGCNGLLPTPSLFEGQCTVCWATEAKKYRLQRS